MKTKYEVITGHKPNEVLYLESMRHRLRTSLDLHRARANMSANFHELKNNIKCISRRRLEDGRTYEYSTSTNFHDVDISLPIEPRESVAIISLLGPISAFRKLLKSKVFELKEILPLVRSAIKHVVSAQRRVVGNKQFTEADLEGGLLQVSLEADFELANWDMSRSRSDNEDLRYERIHFGLCASFPFPDGSVLCNYRCRYFEWFERGDIYEYAELDFLDQQGWDSVARCARRKPQSLDTYVANLVEIGNSVERAGRIWPEFVRDYGKTLEPIFDISPNQFKSPMNNPPTCDFGRAIFLMDGLISAGYLGRNKTLRVALETSMLEVGLNAIPSARANTVRKI